MGKSSRIMSIVLVGAPVFCLSTLPGMLVLLLTLPCYSVTGAVNFSFQGFDQESSVHVVPSGYWKIDIMTGCFKFDPPVAKGYISGQFRYPDAVPILDPGSGTLKSFSTTFIYRLQTVHKVQLYIGPSINFMMAADKGPIVNIMGRQETNDPLSSLKHNESVEFEAFQDQTILYKQLWIDYSEASNRTNFCHAHYKPGKTNPKPKPSFYMPGPDVSLLKENMYIGFSIPEGIDSSIVPYICAWSFSNDGGQAPNIVIDSDASLAAPLAAPYPPPGPQQTPPSPSPSPISLSPSSSSPPHSNSKPYVGPGHEPQESKKALWGCLGALVVPLCLFSLRWSTIWRRPLRVFICHTGGPNGEGKNFPSWLHQAMASHRWSKSKFYVEPFLDVENCPKGLSFAGEILKELERFDVGVVVVTPDFFSKHWPMTELVKFVEAQRKDREAGRIRILPLFYKLTLDEVKQGLDQKTWEHFWDEPSEDNHPLQLQECKDAVAWLCKQTGIRYVSHDRDQDKVYIDTILKEVDKILCDERSIAANLRWVMRKLKITRSGPTATPERV